jgi:hypothetical protein
MDSTGARNGNGKELMMKRSLAAALALVAFVAGSISAPAQQNIWGQPPNPSPQQNAGQSQNVWGQPQNTVGQQTAPPAQCNAFAGLKTDAEQKALTVRAALAKKADRAEICTLVTRFFASEESVVKFLEKNKATCNIPEQAITGAKANHENTLKFRTAACAEEAKPRPPSLSDAINTPSVDTSKNTKTGRGTLDTLNGNPLDNR